ncbi:hypothetical protein ACFX2C_046196 [Malus domestica]
MEVAARQRKRLSSIWNQRNGVQIVLQDRNAGNENGSECNYRRFELRCDLPSNGMRVSVPAKKRARTLKFQREKDNIVGRWRLKDEEKNFVVGF